MVIFPQNGLAVVSQGFRNCYEEYQFRWHFTSGSIELWCLKASNTVLTVWSCLYDIVNVKATPIHTELPHEPFTQSRLGCSLNKTCLKVVALIWMVRFPQFANHKICLWIRQDKNNSRCITKTQSLALRLLVSCAYNLPATWSSSVISTIQEPVLGVWVLLTIYTVIKSWCPQYLRNWYS